MVHLHSNRGGVCAILGAVSIARPGALNLTLNLINRQPRLSRKNGAILGTCGFPGLTLKFRGNRAQSIAACGAHISNSIRAEFPHLSIARQRSALSVSNPHPRLDNAAKPISVTRGFGCAWFSLNPRFLPTTHRCFGGLLNPNRDRLRPILGISPIAPLMRPTSP